MSYDNLHMQACKGNTIVQHEFWEFLTKQKIISIHFLKHTHLAKFVAEVVKNNPLICAQLSESQIIKFAEPLKTNWSVEHVTLLQVLSISVNNL